MHIDLNIFITNIETNLQKKSVGIHEFNGSYSTASAEHYKQKVFSDGDFLHANTKYADQCISCNTVKPKNIILGFFVISFISTTFLMKNYMIDQIIH